MPSRRAFLSLLAGSALAPHVAFAQGSTRRLALYANVGPLLTHYDVDPASAELTMRDSVTLPAAVQYCWPHRNRRYFYVASSSSASGNVAPTGTEHHVTAFKINPVTGALGQIGDPMRLPVRPIHMTLDNDSQHLLVAFNIPSSVRVYRINKDFTPGEEVPQGTIDAGIYAHQVRVTPDGRHVVLVTRGNEGTPQRPEDPGALMVFDYNHGVLANQYRIAPNGGRGYGPRHLDFHPTKPWMYVSIETQNQMHMHRLQGGKPLPAVAFNTSTLLEPHNIRSRQAASTVHVHPNGRFVYGANRSQDVVEFNGKKVYKGGENSIVVYAINQQTVNRRSSSTSKRKRFIRARSTSTRAGACWWRSTTCRWTCATATMCGPCPQGCRSSTWAPTAGSLLHGPTTSMSVTRRCGGWEWWPCEPDSLGYFGGVTPGNHW